MRISVSRRSCLALFLGLFFTSTTAVAVGKLQIAMIQWRGETEACRGFKDAMAEMNYPVQYTVLDAGQDRTHLATLLREELEPNLETYDYIYSYGTTASKMTKIILRNRVPQVFSNVAAPVESEIVASMESSGGNISGTSNRIRLRLQIETAKKILNFKRVGIFFNPREKNAMVIRSTLYDLAEDYDFDVVDFRSPPSQDMLARNLQKLRKNTELVDAVYLPLDSFLLTNAKVIGSELKTAKIKSIAAQKKYIENGALIGVIPDYYQLGKQVAAIVDRHRKGEKLQAIPVVTPEEPLVMINKTTVAHLQIEIPQSLMKNAIVVE